MVDAGRDHLILHSQRSFYQPDDACSRIEMAYIRFDRTNRTKLRRAHFGLIHFLKRLDLNGIPQFRPGPVGFNVADLPGSNAGHTQCLMNHLSLSHRTWRCKTNPLITVVVDGRAADHSLNVIPVPDCVRQPL
ncbi:hypothetical protein D3C73_556680 [compost metagenome]